MAKDRVPALGIYLWGEGGEKEKKNPSPNQPQLPFGLCNRFSLGAIENGNSESDVTHRTSPRSLAPFNYSANEADTGLKQEQCCGFSSPALASSTPTGNKRQVGLAAVASARRIGAQAETLRQRAREEEAARPRRIGCDA